MSIIERRSKPSYDELKLDLLEVQRHLTDYQRLEIERDRLEELAREIANQHGIQFNKLWHRVPGIIYGVPFTTAPLLADMGISKYHEGDNSPISY